MPSVVKNRGKKSGGRKALGLLIEFAITVVAIWLLFSLAGRVLPKIALSQLSELTNTKIDVESVDFSFNGFVYIRNLVIRPNLSAGYDNSILKAKTVNVRFGLGSLLKFRPRIKEIFVNDFTLKVQYDSDNKIWNVSSLKITMPFGGTGRMPQVWFENGKIEYSKVVNSKVRVISSSPVSANLRPEQKLIGGYSFDISAAGKQDLKKAPIFGTWKPGQIVIGGRISSKDLPGFERPWTVESLNANIVYDSNNYCSLTAKIKDFNCPPSETTNVFSFDVETVADKFPFVKGLQDFFNQYNPTGTIDINLQASADITHLTEGKITGKVFCSDVALCDRNFPYAVEHLTGRIDLTEKSAKLNRLTGRHGDTDLAFEGWTANEGVGWNYRLKITSDNMSLDNDLYSALTKEEQKFWSAFSPAGTVSINYSRSQLSPTDRQIALTVQLLSVDAKYSGLGYPLKNAKGMLFFGADSVVFSDVVSQWDGRKITINGKADYVKGMEPSYDFVINGENIPLDATLADSLPPAQKDIYNQFEPAGQFDMLIKVASRNQQQPAKTFTAEIFPKKSSLKPKALPILINDVTGKIVFNPQEVNIGNLMGRYGTGVVALWGRVWPAGEQKELGYCLSMRAKEVELGEELNRTLPKPLATLATQLRPAGKISITADVSKNAMGNCGENRLIIECLDSSIDCNLLPYPLRDISGTIAITQSQIKLENVTARAVHTIRGAPLESEMRITGSVAIDENTPAGETPQIKGGDITFSGENVRFKNKTLSKLDTILAYDAQSQQWLSRYFVADFYGGKMIGKLQLNRAAAGNFDYLLEASVAGADLRQFLSDTEKETKPEEHYSTGSISGSLSIVGSIVEDNIRLGRCRLKVIDMKVGKLSPLAKLLQVLNLTEPSDYAFDQMQVDAYIQNNRMTFRQLDLSGKSLAFDGSGWLDLKTNNINLTLTARGRRLSTARPSIWESLTEGLGRAVVRVEVKGNVSDPQVTTKPLPVIKETLEILGSPRGE